MNPFAALGLVGLGGLALLTAASRSRHHNYLPVPSGYYQEYEIELARLEIERARLILDSAQERSEAMHRQRIAEAACILMAQGIAREIEFYPNGAVKTVRA